MIIVISTPLWMFGNGTPAILFIDVWRGCVLVLERCRALWIKNIYITKWGVSCNMAVTQEKHYIFDVNQLINFTLPQCLHLHPNSPPAFSPLTHQPFFAFSTVLFSFFEFFAGILATIWCKTTHNNAFFTSKNSTGFRTHVFIAITRVL